MPPQQTGLFFLGTEPQGVLKSFPVEYNRSFFKQLDVTFLIILLSCTIVLFGTFIVLCLRPLPEINEKEIQKIQERYAQLVLNQPKKKKEEVGEEGEVPVKKASEDKVKEEEKKEEVDRKNETVEEKKKRKEKTKVNRKERRAAIKKQLQSSGIFAAITASGSGSGSSSSAMSDLLSSSEGVGDIGDIDIEKGSFATKNVTPEMIKKRRGKKTSGVGIQKQGVGKAAGTQIASTGKVNITSAPPKIKGESAGKGSRTQAAINRVVSRQQSRLKKVYESMLKRDPNLGGKLMVKFVIMPDGSVTNVAIVKSTTGNATFDKRIVSYVKRWKFPPISGGGPVEVVFPFVFSGSA